MTQSSLPAAAQSKKRRAWFTVLGVVLPTALLFYLFAGFYTVQPIGGLPDGRTVIVHRIAGEPFFNSPDGVCLERMGGVSLMCRAIAMGEGPTDRIIVRLPYMHWAYLASTGGQEFDR